MKRSSERILTTHVGSLVRPPVLLKYTEAFAEGLAIDSRGYEATLSSAVAEVVRQQVTHGVDVVSDGEFGKAVWTGYSFDRMSGFEPRPAPPDAERFVGREQKRFRE
jgi:5-methyltetrahydropteroyltriglutamate--homocysteine methyltransferase